MSGIVRCPDFVAGLGADAYAFYELGIWKEPDGLYMSTDSGCSCPFPFESHSADDLTGPLTFEQVQEEAYNLARTSRYPEEAIPNVAGLVSDLLAAL